MLKKFLYEEDAQGMVEYILIVVLIAAAVVATVKAFGTQILNLLTGAKNTIERETR